MDYIFYKKRPTDKIWWIRFEGQKGKKLVSFDKKIILNLFIDYPKNFSEEQKQLFDKENPFWANYLSE